MEDKPLRETKKSRKVKKQIDRGFEIAKKWMEED